MNYPPQYDHEFGGSQYLENIVKKYGILKDGEYYIHRSDVRELAEPIWVKLIDIKPRFKNVLEEEFKILWDLYDPWVTKEIKINQLQEFLTKLSNIIALMFRRL